MGIPGCCVFRVGHELIYTRSLQHWITSGKTFGSLFGKIKSIRMFTDEEIECQQERSQCNIYDTVPCSIAEDLYSSDFCSLEWLVDKIVVLSPPLPPPPSSCSPSHAALSGRTVAPPP